MKQFIIALFAVSLLAACGGGADPEKERLQAQIDSLEQANLTSKEEMDSYIGDLTSIQNAMNEVKKRQGLIEQEASNPELGDNAREQITDGLFQLETMLEENKAKIEALNRRVRGNAREMKNLNELIASLQASILAKDVEIEDLKTRLAQLNIRIQEVTQSYDSLAVVNANRGQKIEEQENEMNKAFYTLGEFKELKDKQVITAGGLFTAKSGARLKDDFNKSHFTQVDKRNFTELAINAKKVRLATTHPASSYQLVENDKGVEKLVIKDSKAFWSSGDYLVLILD